MKIINKKYGLLIMFLAVGLLGVASAAQFGNPTTTRGQFQGLDNWQANQPVFSQLYSGQIDTFWPILNNLDSDQCEASSDFIIGIPPGGCTPTVVRSDLLAEQNVPVFCQLYALKVNPLIKASAISSISFKGKYPDGVSGISYHPARAAIKSYDTLLGDPITENIGYVVIILKKEKVEANMSDWIAGNLTATITYDAEQAYGVGRSEFYSGEMNKDNWTRNAEAYSFWRGKGYVRVNEIDPETSTAKIDVMESKDKVLSSFTLKEGQTSNLVYMPGYYCKAGLTVKLNQIESSENLALINLNGEDLWVRKGSSLLNGACKVKDLKSFPDETGTIKISCPGKTINLELTRKSARFKVDGSPNPKEVSLRYNVFDEYYLAYFGNIPKIYDEKTPEVAIVVKGKKALSDEDTASLYSEIDKLSRKKLSTSEKAADDKIKLFKDHIADEMKGEYASLASFSVIIKDAEKPTKIEEGGKTYTVEFLGHSTKLTNRKLSSEEASAFEEANKSLNELLTTYKSVKNPASSKTMYSEEALDQQIILSKEMGLPLYEKSYIEIFLREFPASSLKIKFEERLKALDGFDLSKAVAGVLVNGKYNTFGLHQLKYFDKSQKVVKIKVDSLPLSGPLAEETTFPLDTLSEKATQEFIFVEKILPGRVTLRYENKDKEAKIRSDRKTIKEDGKATLGGKTVTIESINAEEVAHLTLNPQIKHTKTEADFTFKIGIEKRGIQLSPEKTKEMLRNINKSIEKFENINNRLGEVVKAMKGTCFAVSTVLTLKNMANNFDGTSMARQKVMERYKVICEKEYGKELMDKCYLDKSSEIQDEIDNYKAALNKVNEDLENAQGGNTKSSAGVLGEKTITNMSIYRENCVKNWLVGVCLLKEWAMMILRWFQLIS